MSKVANEKRLIDAADWDSFYADMGDSRNTMDSYDRGYTDALDRVDDWMDAQPTVDAVEVVRCKDCKHWLKDVAGCTDSVGRCEWANYMVGAVGYCVYGERKHE